MVFFEKEEGAPVVWLYRHALSFDEQKKKDNVLFLVLMVSRYVDEEKEKN